MLLVANLEINRGVCPPSRGPLLGCGVGLSATVAHAHGERLRPNVSNRTVMNLFDSDAIHSLGEQYVSLTLANVIRRRG